MKREFEEIKDKIAELARKENVSSRVHDCLFEALRYICEASLHYSTEDCEIHGHDVRYTDQSYGLPDIVDCRRCGKKL